LLIFASLDPDWRRAIGIRRYRRQLRELRLTLLVLYEYDRCRDRHTAAIGGQFLYRPYIDHKVLDLYAGSGGMHEQLQLLVPSEWDRITIGASINRYVPIHRFDLLKKFVLIDIGRRGLNGHRYKRKSAHTNAVFPMSTVVDQPSYLGPEFP